MSFGEESRGHCQMSIEEWLLPTFYSLSPFTEQKWQQKAEEAENQIIVFFTLRALQNNVS